MPGSFFQPLTHSLTTLSSVACDLARLLRPGEKERIANELKPKPTIQASPRTVGKYLHRVGPVRAPT
jgi:hypothetical protein